MIWRNRNKLRSISKFSDIHTKKKKSPQNSLIASINFVRPTTKKTKLRSFETRKSHQFSYKRFQCFSFIPIIQSLLSWIYCTGEKSEHYNCRQADWNSGFVVVVVEKRKWCSASNQEKEQERASVKEKRGMVQKRSQSLNEATVILL